MIGSVIGSYRILCEVGKGGMGRVYLAEHTLIGKRAAVKVLLPQYSADAGVTNRFFNEARSLTRLNHPGIVDVYDFGYLPDGSAFMLMEYLEGESLKSLMTRSGRLAYELILDLGRQVAIAVAAAHAKQIIHRDLKPDNIFLVPEEAMAHGLRAKVLDFGIAKLGREPSVTQTGAVIGTPNYMSPEQFQSATTLDHRTDIYSLGCVLYRMAAGRPPFVSKDSTALIAAHLFEAPPPLTDVPEALNTLIMTALAKPREQRFQSMNELARALGHGGEASQVVSLVSLTAAAGTMAATPPPSAPVEAVVTGVSGISIDVESPPSVSMDLRPRHRGRVVVAVLALALLGGVAVVRLTARPPATVSPAPSPPAPAPAATPPAAAPIASPPPPSPAIVAPRRVRLSLSSEPPGADVYRDSDGIRLGKTPWTGEYPPSEGQLVLLVRRAGYREARVIFPVNRDNGQSLVLTRTTPRGAGDSKKSSRSDTQPDSEDGIIDPFKQK